MRTLLTWSDRGSGPRSHHGRRPAGDVGPVMRLVRNSDRYACVLVLCPAAGRERAEGLLADLRGATDSAQLSALSITDPSDHAALFAAMRSALPPRETSMDVLLSAGTPQVQTLWVILSQAGLLGDARLLQVIPPDFVPDPHPHPVREVRLDIEGFPEIRALRDEVRRLRATEGLRRGGLVAESPPMRALLARLARVAPSQVPVLIAGETGSGKELIARALHRQSARADGPFVAESCGALAENLLASELFGHEAGAFTGAIGRRRGLLELAHGGTLFLDEVGEMSPAVQAMLLRVLQEGVLRRVGGERVVRVDVRLVTATHRDLRGGDFRADLYWRIVGATLTVPPLRERPEDLSPLVRRFLSQAGRPALVIDPEVWRLLETCPWPGNVRQLQAEVRRWCLFADDGVTPELLSEEVRGGSRTPRPPRRVEPLREAVERAERGAIGAALAAHRGQLAPTARALRIDRNTLRRKLSRLGIPREG